MITADCVAAIFPQGKIESPEGFGNYLDWFAARGFKSVPSCRRWKYPVIRLLINREAVRNLPWIPFLPRQNYKIVKTLIPMWKPLDRMAQTFFRWPQRLIKQMLHGLHYIFLWQTLTPPQHVFGDEKPFCVFLFLLPHFHLVTAVVNLC